MPTFETISSKALVDEIDANTKITDLVAGGTVTSYEFSIEREGIAVVSTHDVESQKIFREEVTDLSQKIMKISVEDAEVKGEKQKERAFNGFSEFCDSIKEETRVEKGKLSHQYADLTKFKRENELNRLAVYPEKRTTLWAVILLMISIEATVNSGFFALANDFGLVGGFLYALILAFINVGIAFFAAIAIKYVWHKKPLNTIAGVVSTFLLGTLLFVLVLFVGHYRAALEEDPKGATFRAVESMGDNIFGITTFDSWLLVAITIVLFTIAFYKCFTNDDVYPEYGKQDRLYKKAQEHYDEIIIAAEEAIEEKRVEFVELFNSEVEVIAQFDLEISHLMDEIRGINAEFLNYRSRQKDQFENFSDAVRREFTTHCHNTRIELPKMPEDYLNLNLPIVDEAPNAEIVEQANVKRNFLKRIREELVPQWRKSLINEMNEVRKKVTNGPFKEEV